MKHFAWVVILTLIGVAVFAQEKNTPEEYVEMYYPIAVKKMHEYKIPASITLAQGILESGSGNSALSKNANNHFGIKCHTDWTGDGYYMDDDEANECFRVYDTPEGSYADHSIFLTSRVRYKFIFDECDIDDYKCWAKGLKKAGYATNPKYPDLLIGLVERYSLDKYDKMSVEDLSPTTETTDTTWQVPNDENIISQSEEVFEINKRKVIRSNGKQLLDIAISYDIPLEKLLAWNDMVDGDILSNNQFVFLEKKRKKGLISSYIVRRGETMWEISQKNGIQLSKLYAKNKIPLNMHAKPGEKLSLKGKVSNAPAYYSYEEVMKEKKAIETENTPVVEEVKENIPTDSRPEKEEIINVKPEKEKTEKYTVKAGDTLYGISNRFFIPVEELIKINNLDGTTLSIGQVLLVSPKK